jgi:hypothetical protein
MATTQIEKIEKALQAIRADAVQRDSSERKRADEAREQAERSFRPTDKEAWLRIAQEWMKLAQTRDEPVVGVIGALSLIHAVK